MKADSNPWVRTRLEPWDEAMKARIYTDTSVLGGCEDVEFAEYSVRLMNGFMGGDRVLVLSTRSSSCERSATGSRPRSRA